MLTADEIRDKLRCVDDGAALAVLAALAGGHVYEADRLMVQAMGPLRGDEAHEIIASLVRGTVTR